MQKRFTRFLAFVALFVSFAFVGPTGCATKLAPDGVYQGDALLYNAEKTITTAYKSFDSFVKWEYDYRAILPVEVSRAADTIRLNSKKWLNSAMAMRDAYVALPSKENRDKLTVSLSLIDSALSEAAKFIASKKSVAPLK